MVITIIRTFIMYIFVTIAIRLMGKRQIGDMQPNELVVTLLISEIAAIPLQDSSQPILNGIIAIFVLVILEILVSILSMKCFSIRKALCGQSVVVIKNGVVDQHAMRNVRMTVVDLIELLRGQNIFDISTVDFAVLEVNGDLSVLLKPENQNATLKDLKIEGSNNGLPLPIIADGEIVKESLSPLQINKNDIYNILSKENLSVKDVFLMTLDRYNNKNIVIKRDKQ